MDSWVDEMAAPPSFDRFFHAATGRRPYRFQRRLADDWLPDVLEAPTGSGKTAALVLAWLWRRRFHPDEQVRASTARRLAFALPMRVLVEQTHEAIDGWLDGIGLRDTVGLQTLMGGMARRHQRGWLDLPERDTILVGTVDMLLSRALNRGYGESRYVWPVTFGLLNADTHWVFDEIQLMGAAVPTSRQLAAFRAALGTAAPCSTTWMSATVDVRTLRTVDNLDVASPVRVDGDDEQGPLVARLHAPKWVARLELPARGEAAYVRALAGALREHHRSGTRTIAIVNTVARAQKLARRLERDVDVPVTLLHSRYRPADRAAAFAEATAPVDSTSDGRIVVATQVIEAGVDMSSRTLLTEAAPWSSIVQRAGRCNRFGEVRESDGEERQARLLWVEPPDAAPYDAEEVGAAVALLRMLDGEQATPRRLLDIDAPSPADRHPVLRRRDIVGLFDTTPDVSGNDLDVSRYIRAADQLDAQVAWRRIRSGAPDPDVAPTSDELCPVSTTALRKWMKDGGRKVYVSDPVSEAWRELRRGELRPGLVVVLDAADGGYHPRWGWDPDERASVPLVAGGVPEPLTSTAEVAGDDPLSALGGRWVPLLEHLDDVERETRRLLDAMAPSGLTGEHWEAAAVAGRLHDLGKAHAVFQRSLARLASDADREWVCDGRPWAKSGVDGRLRHDRPHFRHELASALAVLGDGRSLLDGTPEPDLVAYLIAAHHGRVRLAIRSLPDELTEDLRVALGVHDGDLLPRTEVPGGESPSCTLDLSPMDLGSVNGEPSWTARALALRDRADLGPFRLAFLEAVVRLADWRASAMERTRELDDGAAQQVRHA